MNITDKLAALSIEIPTLAASFGAYVPAKRVGNLVYVSGQLPMKDGKLLASGQVPGRCPVEQAKTAARQCVINALAAVMTVLPDLSKLRACCGWGVSYRRRRRSRRSRRWPMAPANCCWSCSAARGSTPRRGRVNTLPLDAAVEIEFIFEVE